MHFDCFFAADADGDIPIGISHHHRAFDRRGQTTGARYVSSEKFHENDVTRFGQASDTRQTFKSRLVAQGRTPDMTTRNVVRVISDRSGTIRVKIDKATVRCPHA